MTSSTRLAPDIEEIHLTACRNKEKIYIDPHTGLSCWTEIAHLQRGVCCGRQCRHCPYGWENVASTSRSARLKSGDKERARLLLQTYKSQEQGPIETTTDEVKKKECHSSDGTIASPTRPNAAASTAPPLTGGALGGVGTTKNVPYTRAGDRGASLLPSGQWRSKDDRVFEAMGTVDELCSVVGVCHALLVEQQLENDVLCDWLVDVMSRLFDIGSQLAVEDTTSPSQSSPQQETATPTFFDSTTAVPQLEVWIDTMTEELPELTSFVLPTGSVVSAQLHVARTVCRRAERLCAPHPYLNRLSDFLFTAARHVNYRDRRSDSDGGNRATQSEWLYRKPHATSTRRTVVHTVTPAQPGSTEDDDDDSNNGTAQRVRWVSRLSKMVLSYFAAVVRPECLLICGVQGFHLAHTANTMTTHSGRTRPGCCSAGVCRRCLSLKLAD